MKALGLALLLALAPPAPGDMAAERRRMVLEVRNLAATAGPTELRRLDREVLRAMEAVPRHLFVPEALRAHAYENRPLPIGCEATISQPTIVALMTDLLDVKPGDRVLEVGTGSGYQAAILSRLGAGVHTIEIVEPLAHEAAARLQALGYPDVEVRAGDGYLGMPDRAPFDAIIVTAGASHVPRPLLDQLRPGGRMVIPAGRTPEDLRLLLIRKNGRGRVTRRALLPVNFVPLTRAEPKRGD